MKSPERKREEAQARQAAYDALSPLEKLERIGARPGESRRERARIEAVSK